MTRVLISGSRSWFTPTLAYRIVSRLVNRYGRENLTIVHGAGTGIDQAFNDAAVAGGVTVERFPADWDNLNVPGALIRRNKAGKEFNANAGPRRNQAMIDTQPNIMIACHKSIKFSKGTGGCCRLAFAAGIPVYLIDAEDAEPKRITELL